MGCWADGGSSAGGIQCICHRGRVSRSRRHQGAGQRDFSNPLHMTWIGLKGEEEKKTKEEEKEEEKEKQEEEMI